MTSCFQLEVCALNYGQACDYMGMAVEQLRRHMFGQGKDPRYTPFSNTGVDRQVQP